MGRAGKDTSTGLLDKTSFFYGVGPGKRHVPDVGGKRPVESGRLQQD